jgi:hypothetical protein
MTHLHEHRADEGHASRVSSVRTTLYAGLQAVLEALGVHELERKDAWSCPIRGQDSGSHESEAQKSPARAPEAVAGRKDSGCRAG